jgi:hypothetical protein
MSYTASAICDYASTTFISDYNDLYCEEYLNNCLVKIGTTNYLNLANWQVTGHDLNSISEIPNFIESDLHIDGNIPNHLESRASPILGIDTDFDGESRQATHPDIGADEFFGIVGDIIFADNFEAYTAGVRLAQQSASWTTWSGLPGSSEDPFVTNAHGHSGVNSVVITQNNDLVKTYGSLITGKYVIAFYAYIPGGKAGYFNTLSGFTPNPYEWGMECYFDQWGAGRAFCGSATVVNFSYPYNVWFPVDVIVDLNNDLAEMYVDYMLIHSWQWTAGSSGNGSQLRLDANDFFGATVNDEMYVDDFSFTRLDVFTGIVNPVAEIPTEFALDQNYPNPFNPTTTIKYALEEDAQVTLKIYNMLGQEVRTLINGRQEAGFRQIMWDGLNNAGSRVTSGIYFYRLTASNYTAVKKMLLLK